MKSLCLNQDLFDKEMDKLEQRGFFSTGAQNRADFNLPLFYELARTYAALIYSNPDLKIDPVREGGCLTCQLSITTNPFIVLVGYLFHIPILQPELLRAFPFINVSNRIIGNENPHIDNLLRIAIDMRWTRSGRVDAMVPADDSTIREILRCQIIIPSSPRRPSPLSETPVSKTFSLLYAAFTGTPVPESLKKFHDEEFVLRTSRMS